MPGVSFTGLKPRCLQRFTPLVSSECPKIQFSGFFQLLELYSLAHGFFSIFKASSIASANCFLLRWSNSPLWRNLSASVSETLGFVFELIWDIETLLCDSTDLWVHWLIPFFLILTWGYVYWFLRAGGGRERKREQEGLMWERNISCLPYTPQPRIKLTTYLWLILLCALTWDWTYNLGLLRQCPN